MICSACKCLVYFVSCCLKSQKGLYFSNTNCDCNTLVRFNPLEKSSTYVHNEKLSSIERTEKCWEKLLRYTYYRKVECGEFFNFWLD